VSKSTPSLLGVSMLVDASYQHAVGYGIAYGRTAEGADSVSPIGTAFLVREFNDPEEFLPQTSTVYVSTARHVISQALACGHELFIRLNIPEVEGYKYFPLAPEEWQLHPATDVAICEFPYQVPVESIPTTSFATDYDVGHLVPGYEVFMAGLFYPVPSEKQIEPLVRFGRLCRPRTRVGVRLLGVGFRKRINR
jgi:hypothetical protein